MKKVVSIILIITMLFAFVACGSSGKTNLPGNVKWGDDFKKIEKAAEKMGASSVEQDSVGIAYTAYNVEYLFDDVPCVVEWWVSPEEPLDMHVSVSYFPYTNKDGYSLPAPEFSTVRSALRKEFGEWDSEETDGVSSGSNEVYWYLEDTTICLYEFGQGSNLAGNVYIDFEQKK